MTPEQLQKSITNVTRWLQNEPLSSVDTKKVPDWDLPPKVAPSPVDIVVDDDFHQMLGVPPSGSTKTGSRPGSSARGSKRGKNDGRNNFRSGGHPAAAPAAPTAKDKGRSQWADRRPRDQEDRGSNRDNWRQQPAQPPRREPPQHHSQPRQQQQQQSRDHPFPGNQATKTDDRPEDKPSNEDDDQFFDSQLGFLLPTFSDKSVKYQLLDADVASPNLFHVLLTGDDVLESIEDVAEMLLQMDNYFKDRTNPEPENSWIKTLRLGSCLAVHLEEVRNLESRFHTFSRPHQRRCVRHLKTVTQPFPTSHFSQKSSQVNFLLRP